MRLNIGENLVLEQAIRKLVKPETAPYFNSNSPAEVERIQDNIDLITSFLGCAATKQIVLPNTDVISVLEESPFVLEYDVAPTLYLHPYKAYEKPFERHEYGVSLSALASLTTSHDFYVMAERLFTFAQQSENGRPDSTRFRYYSSLGYTNTPDYLFPGVDAEQAEDILQRMQAEMSELTAVPQ